MNNSQQNTNGYLGTNVIENDAADFFFFIKIIPVKPEFIAYHLVEQIFVQRIIV